MYRAAMLGYLGNDEWRDMSEYVVHFTKTQNGNDDRADSAYNSIISILSSGELVAGASFGMAYRLRAPQISQRSVCFSEIPLEYLSRLVARRSSFGLAFRRSFITSVGGERVWYVDKDGPVADALNAIRDGVMDTGDWTSDFWKLTRFIDLTGKYGATRYEFEWEREWRVPDKLTFSTEDVAFLFLPEDLHTSAQSFFRYVREENLGPAYECPILDPAWGEIRLTEMFSELGLGTAHSGASSS